MRRRYAPMIAVMFLAWTAVAAHATTKDPRLLTAGATNFHLTATFQAACGFPMSAAVRSAPSSKAIFATISKRRPKAAVMPRWCSIVLPIAG